MATFLVERFWPDVTREGVEAATVALRIGRVDVVETILAAPDELCLWFVEAVSEHAVAAGFAAAAVPYDRLTVALRIPA